MWATYREQPYSGAERLVVLTPRGRVLASEGIIPVRAVVLTGGSYSEDGTPSVSFRALGGTEPWKRIQMTRTTAQRHTWTAQIPLPISESGDNDLGVEYYVSASTLTAPVLEWPPGGAPNAQTVVVSP